MTTKRRGGRRPGSGAPKGNRNAVRSGKYLRDTALRDALGRVPPGPDRDAILRGLKGGETIKPAQPGPPPANVLPMHDLARARSTPTAPPTKEQSNPYNQLAARLESYSFRAATHFVRQHYRHTAAIEDALDYVDALPDGEYPRNPAGLIRDDVHRNIAIPQDGAVICPACKWGQFTLEEGTGS